MAGAVAYRPAADERQRQDAIREASVVWRTASEDSLPQVLLEAAASGTVIVATAVGGIPELLDDGVDGMLVPPEDAAALAQATARVLSRPFLAESLATNARISAERFTWRRHRASFGRLYGLAPRQPALATKRRATKPMARPTTTCWVAPSSVVGPWAQRWRRGASAPRQTSESNPDEKHRATMMRLLVVLGEGGHTRQMLQLLDQLGPQL